MKSVMNRKVQIVLVWLMVSAKLVAQSNLGEIKGRIIDKGTKEAVGYADVLVFKDDIRKAYAITDW
jgi:hypothetical protein